MSSVLRGGGCRLLRSALAGCLVWTVGATVLVLGMRVPATLIEPGIDSFEGEEKDRRRFLLLRDVAQL